MRPEGRSGAFLRTVCFVLATGVCYYVATQIAWALCFPDSKVSLFFPPHAVLVSILLLVPTRHWWAYVLAATIAHFLATQQAHWPPLYALHCEAFDVVQNVATAAGIRIFIRSPLKALTLRDAMIFVLIAVVLVPFGTAFWGAAFTVSNGFGTHYWIEWRNLGISNAVTAVVLVPALLLGAYHLMVIRPKFSSRRVLEAALLGACTVGVGIVVFNQTPAGTGTSPQLLYLTVPPLIWATLRFGLGGISVSMLIITFQAIWGTMHGHGPFLTQTPAENALELQLFLLMTATPLIYTKSRHAYWQIVDMEPIHDANGKLVNWMAIQTDVTAHRLAEQHLRVLNERLQLATQSAALGVWEWDAVSQKHTWDERTHAIHGLKPGEYDGSFEAWMRCLHPEDRALAEARFRLVLGGGSFYDQEFRVIRSGETTLRHVESRAIVQRDGQGKLLRITGTSRDVTAERENEERLQTLTERWQLALRATRYGVWDWDPVTGRLIWDDRLFEIYGVARESFESTYQARLDLLHPEDRPRAEQEEQDALSLGREEFKNEFRIVLPDNFVRHIEAHGYIRRDEHGRAVRVVGMDRDITAEKQTLEALRMAEERWQLAVQGTNDGVWDWNVPSGATYHDQRWSQMLGYEVGEISDSIESWNSLVHPDDLPGCMAATEDHFARRTALYHHEYRMRTRQGDWKWILDRGKVVTRDAQGRPLRMVGMHTDVTARKNLEQRLHQFEQLATQVSELAQIGGWELDLETMNLRWSEQVRRIHEVDANFRPSVQSAIEFFAPEARDIMSTAFKNAMSQGRDYDLELPLITALGRRIWVRALTRAEFQDNKPVRLIGAFQDISIRRESEEGRRKLEFQLFQAQKMETLGTLAGGIAHDFNNLLTGIMGYQELVADVLEDNTLAREYLAEARGASLRARDLVEQILTFGRQSPDDQYMPLDLGLVIEEARRLLRATIPATIAIETHISPDCGSVQGDATQIHQVILNLGSNAAHAMHAKGGVLSISLEPVDRETSRSATLATLPAGEYLRLTVSDNGHGMEETTLQRIFDPFFTTKEVREGTGLGLAVVHGIVRAHRGGVDVESRLGQGSTFHIYLPMAASEAEATPGEILQSPRGDNEVIFIVDDEDTVATFTKYALENKGYRASTIDTAALCLETLRANPGACSVLVTDQTMPGMTGTELAGKVREFAPRLPIIVMSGYFLKIPPEEIERLGHVELLGKPFTADELAWMVHRALHPDAPGGPRVGTDEAEFVDDLT